MRVRARVCVCARGWRNLRLDLREVLYFHEWEKAKMRKECVACARMLQLFLSLSVVGGGDMIRRAAMRKARRSDKIQTCTVIKSVFTSHTHTRTYVCCY